MFLGDQAVGGKHPCLGIKSGKNATTHIATHRNLGPRTKDQPGQFIGLGCAVGIAVVKESKAAPGRHFGKVTKRRAGVVNAESVARPQINKEMTRVRRIEDGGAGTGIGLGSLAERCSHRGVVDTTRRNAVDRDRPCVDDSRRNPRFKDFQKRCRVLGGEDTLKHQKLQLTHRIKPHANGNPEKFAGTRL